MTIKLYLTDKIKILEFEQYQNLMQVLHLNNIKLDFVCSGNGICGKCKIQDINNKLPISENDKKFFTTAELNKGYRLACSAYPYDDLKIRIIDDYNYSNILNHNSNDFSYISNSYGVAIDIGTTTIAMELIEINTKKTISTCTLLNSQKIYGADIISRIQSSITGNSQKLRKCIQNDILDGLKILSNGIKLEIAKIVIAANTTMIHLLMGFDCKGIATFPFSAFTLDKLELSFYEVFESNLFDCDISILPCISTHIGGDILSGILMCNFDKSENNIMLIDIGTNGEMVIGNKNKILCTSAAAGPALEGGNISCGIGGIEGAISKIKIEHNKIDFDTIGNKEPIGICGSAVIDIVAEALKNNLIDPTGLLKNYIFDSGIKIASSIEQDIFFTQKDFRQVQLAKSAIYCAIKILTKNYNQIDTVFIAGNFGYYINIDNAISIGVIPSCFKNKIKTIGNSSLNGAKIYLLDDSCDKRLKHILDISEEMYLANDNNFNELFINNMNFKQYIF